MRYSAMAMLVCALGVAPLAAQSPTPRVICAVLKEFTATSSRTSTRGTTRLISSWKSRSWEDATLNATVQSFADEAKKAGATKVRIVQSDTSVMWYFPPILGFILTPVYTNVAGDALLP